MQFQPPSQPGLWPVCDADNKAQLVLVLNPDPSVRFSLAHIVFLGRALFLGTVGDLNPSAEMPDIWYLILLVLRRKTGLARHTSLPLLRPARRGPPVCASSIV